MDDEPEDGRAVFAYIPKRAIQDVARNGVGGSRFGRDDASVFPTDIELNFFEVVVCFTTGTELG
jgi:hypothetical protein